MEKFIKSKLDLGYGETIIKLKEMLKHCHPSNGEKLIQEVNDAKMNKGSTIFDWIEESILDNINVMLFLE
ncbi:hypothetical protein [Peribacillus frigoritolerans]|uniref:hypothetical protein n=1 Tax=Peribacillus frigoritolerans TaxID=450367 RepID=UPI0023D9DD47|nr:hypothetical protein [Peribacillus frigoritolerans]MDF1996306.1 hypothetical protein [Peribacillus frigoritolerans]